MLFSEQCDRLVTVIAVTTALRMQRLKNDAELACHLKFGAPENVRSKSGSAGHSGLSLAFETTPWPYCVVIASESSQNKILHAGLLKTTEIVEDQKLKKIK